MGRKEHDVEDYLCRWVELYGGLPYKFTSPGRRNVPDRLCVMPGGKVFFVECKAPGKELEPGQRREIRKLRDLGATVYVIDSTVGTLQLLQEEGFTCLIDG